MEGISLGAGEDMLSGIDTLLKKYICASCVCLRNTEMDRGQGDPENGFTSQEVEEIVFLDEIEKELQSIEKSFDSGNMQAFGRNRDDIMNRFVEYRRKDEEVFHRHCDAILKSVW